MRQYGADGRRDNVSIVRETMLNKPKLHLLSLSLAFASQLPHHREPLMGDYNHKKTGDQWSPLLDII